MYLKIQNTGVPLINYKANLGTVTATHHLQRNCLLTNKTSVAGGGVGRFPVSVCFTLGFLIGLAVFRISNGLYIYFVTVRLLLCLRICFDHISLSAHPC